MRLCLILTLLIACDCGGEEPATCTSEADCPGGICIDGMCRALADGGETDTGSDSAAPDAGCEIPCAEVCCDTGQVCAADRCVIDRGPCETDDECLSDSYCSVADGRCFGFEENPDRHPECVLPAVPGMLNPVLRCEWTGPPEGDAYPSHNQVQSIPLVVDFGIGRGPDDPPRPSIVLVTTSSSGGTSVASIVRVIDGATCEQQYTLDDASIVSDGTLAVGDITGDGFPDIVGHTTDGSVVAWERTSDGFSLLWTTPGMSGRSHNMILADIDDDAVPEIIAGAQILGADGMVRSTMGGAGPASCGDIHDSVVVADVDRDGRVELVADTMIYEWDSVAGDVAAEPYFVGPGRAGFVAVADFGEFEGAAEDAPERPEVVVVNGAVTLHTVGGEIVYGPVTLPGGRSGGNPTIADFDGDGAPEIGVAGFSEFTVFDPRCGNDALPGSCESGRTDGVLWSHPIQENSCAVMGSTVFDFEGDGSAEVVYADECFMRIFDGREGQVVWSHPSGSATWQEAPIVADADGDFHADLLLPSVSFVPSCPGLDPYHPGHPCMSDADCAPTGAGCQGGLCRCESTDDCEDPAFDCAPPIDASDAMGNVCRAAFRDLPVGLRVFHNPNRRWATSRRVWNQHGYFIDNIEVSGVVPRSSNLQPHWLGSGLNSFRQNSQGELPPNAAPDLTVRGDSFGRDCSEEMPVLPLTAAACNRGSLPVAAPISVGFYEGSPGEAMPVCEAFTSTVLQPGECELVSCAWDNPPIATPVELTIQIDAEDRSTECLSGNNLGSLIVQCPPPLQ